MAFQSVDNSVLMSLRDRIENLAKSFATAGYQGLQNQGRSGISALAQDGIDPILYSITITDKNFKLTKGIQMLNATDSVYGYRIKTSVATSGLDLSGFENFMPQEDMAEYIRVYEPLKVYGLRSTLGQMVQFTNAAQGYGVDVEKEMDENAAKAMAEQFERDGYVGGDYYMTPAGQIDVQAPLQFLGSQRIPVIRSIRGIQNNIREGNNSMRGIPGDLEAYGASFRTVINQMGAIMDQDLIDDVGTVAGANLGQVDEAHANFAQISEFRKSFYGLQRGDISTKFAINGPDVENNNDGGFTVVGASGPIAFIPCVFKWSIRQRAIPVQGTYASAPATPVVSGIAQAAVGSTLVANQIYTFVVQACNMNGLSTGAVTAPQTVALTGNSIALTIAAQPGVEYFNVFATPYQAQGALGSEGFVGRVVASATGSTLFTFINTIIPCLESVLFLPKDDARVKMAKLGPNLVNKVELGKLGLADSKLYSSYLCIVVYKPRSLVLVDNVFAKRRSYGLNGATY